MSITTEHNQTTTGVKIGDTVKVRVAKEYDTQARSMRRGGWFSGTVTAIRTVTFQGERARLLQACGADAFRESADVALTDGRRLDWCDVSCLGAV